MDMGQNRQQKRAEERARRRAEEEARANAQTTPLTNPPAPTAIPWHERWRGGIRAGETAVILGLVIGAISVGGDMTEMSLLLFAAWIVSALSLITTDGLTIAIRWLLVAGAGIVFIFIWLLIHFHSEPSGVMSNDGFLQLETTELIAGETSLSVGKSFRKNFHLFNRGGRPVHDSQAWGGFIIAEPALNTDEHIQQIFKKGIDDGYTKFVLHTGSIGVNREMWNTAVSEPITQEQIDGLMSKKLRLWFLVGAVWKTENNTQQSEYWCDWVDGLGPSAEVAGRPWKICD